MKPLRCNRRTEAPAGAAVNSQGDQPTGRCPPLDIRKRNAKAPIGATEASTKSFALPGLRCLCIRTRGSRPWLLTFAPAGAGRLHPAMDQQFESRADYFRIARRQTGVFHRLTEIEFKRVTSNAIETKSTQEWSYQKTGGRVPPFSGATPPA